MPAQPITSDVAYPVLPGIIDTDKILVVTAEGLRKVLKSSLTLDASQIEAIDASQVEVDDTGFTELVGTDLAEILTFIDTNGVGGGVEFDPSVTITLEATDEPDPTSWFGDGTLWKYIEFSVTSTDEMLLITPSIVSGATNNGGIEVWIFDAADYVGGQIVSSASDVSFTDNYPTSVGEQATQGFRLSLPVGDYVAAIGVWFDTDVGTIIDVAPFYYGLGPGTDLPDVGVPAIPGVPLTVVDGVLVPFFDSAEGLNNLTNWGNGALGVGNNLQGAGGNVAVGNGSAITAGFGNIAIGSYHTISAVNGGVAIGRFHSVSQDNSVALGINAKPRMPGAVAHQASGHSSGNRQYERALLTGTGNNRLVTTTGMPATTATAFEVTMVARTPDTTSVKAWKITGVAAVNAGGTVRVVGTPAKTVLAEDAGATGWDVTVGFDTSGIALTPSGLGGTEVVVATVEFTELVGT